MLKFTEVKLENGLTLHVGDHVVWADWRGQECKVCGRITNMTKNGVEIEQSDSIFSLDYSSITGRVLHINTMREIQRPQSTPETNEAAGDAPVRVGDMVLFTIPYANEGMSRTGCVTAIRSSQKLLDVLVTEGTYRVPFSAVCAKAVVNDEGLCSLVPVDCPK